MEMSSMDDASWPVQTLCAPYKGKWRTQIDKYLQVHRCKKPLNHIYLRNINYFHGNLVVHTLLKPKGLFMTFLKPQNKSIKICFGLRTLSLILHHINCYKELRVVCSARRADLLFWGGKEAGGWQRVPPTKHGIQENNSSGIKWKHTLFKCPPAEELWKSLLWGLKRMLEFAYR